MNISENGKNLIKRYEGCRLVAYKVLDSEQFYTIGWGHYGSDVYKSMMISQKVADALFDNDILRYVNAVKNTKFGFTPNQNQFDALCSFCYNLGTGIMKDFIGKSAEQVVTEMLLYVRSGGTVLQGLVNRRKKEVELFNTPIKSVVTSEKILKEYAESGTFFPTTTIYFRNRPIIEDSNPRQGSYLKGESVIYDKVVITNNYVYISWISVSTGIRRYMPVREIKNGTYQELWGYIK